MNARTTNSRRFDERRTMADSLRPNGPNAIILLDRSRPLGKFADDFAVSMQVEEIAQPVAQRTGEVSLPGLILLPVVTLVIPTVC
jgi:hypothetical protein